ncbi:hypothetical protein HK099_001160 [Clydaea vesicula]|uniref:Large ribosomal subunit protein uL14m n=1 Tax=Clydaea vesicula TaxID=447962 RepID=A0AAD5U793_9FUNG|nr:hypothetical protein HK099_001160 [Clydaea vesicula]KAJ3385768.1 hypothetical protein HDU92_002864 [Lobulomyces angularis]
MIQLKSLLKVIDNSGAQIVECINIMGTRGRIGYVGDEIVCVVKKAKTAEASTKQATSSTLVSKLRKGEVCRAIIVRTKKETLRKDGTFIKFDDNAVVMINKQGQPLGNRILGVIASEVRQKRWAKIASLAPRVV